MRRASGIAQLFLFLLSGLLILSLITLTLPVRANTDVDFSGTLISETCKLDSESEDMTINFGPVATKAFIGTNEAVRKRFSILLKECDPEVGSQVVVTFNGNKESEDSDLFLVTGIASGIALKITDDMGEIVKPGDPQKSTELSNGDTELNWQASIVKTTRGDMNPGDFYAIINLSIEYP